MDDLLDDKAKIEKRRAKDETVRCATPVLWIIIPCYNEEKVLPLTSEMFLNKLLSLISAGDVDEQSKLLYVNGE